MIPSQTSESGHEWASTLHIHEYSVATLVLIGGPIWFITQDMGID